MNANHRRSIFLGFLSFAIGLTVNPEPWQWRENGVVSEANARVGRPVTPYSAAGVARRTTRRVIRRSTVYIAALPAGCDKVVINGTNLYLCSGVYYQPNGTQYVIVTVD
jgi:hypothetical protein